MAKIVYGSGLGNGGIIPDFYDADLDLLDGSSTAERVVFKDTGNGNDRMVITGSGFQWQEGSDVIGFGTIKGINFTDASGDVSYMKISGLDMEVGFFNEAYANDGIGGVMALLMRGADTITGSDNADYITANAGADLVRGGKGADVIRGGSQADRLYGDAGNDDIWGNRGSDRMWGGTGSDDFTFVTGDGKDTIGDFDATGGGNKQDYLRLLGGVEFTIAKSGDDLVLDFGGGDTLTLLDVRRSDFSRSDDVVWILS